MSNKILKIRLIFYWFLYFAVCSFCNVDFIYLADMFGDAKLELTLKIIRLQVTPKTTAMP